MLVINCDWKSERSDLMIRVDRRIGRLRQVKAAKVERKMGRRVAQWSGSPQEVFNRRLFLQAPLHFLDPPTSSAFLPPFSLPINSLGCLTSSWSIVLTAIRIYFYIIVETGLCCLSKADVEMFWTGTLRSLSHNGMAIASKIRKATTWVKLSQCVEKF